MKGNMKTLLKYEAPWCNGCKVLTNLLKDVDLSGIEVVPINIDVDTASAKAYNVRGLPTLITLDETGEELKRSTGALTKDQLVKFLGDTQ